MTIFEVIEYLEGVLVANNRARESVRLGDAESVQVELAGLDMVEPILEYLNRVPVWDHCSSPPPASEDDRFSSRELGKTDEVLVYFQKTNRTESAVYYHKLNGGCWKLANGNVVTPDFWTVMPKP